MLRAYKFRLQPNNEQKVLIHKTFGCTRFVYNKMLAERIEIYNNELETGEKQKLPTPAKYKEEFVWLKEVDSLALANAQLNLQKAYSNFFRRVKDSKCTEKGFPKFKRKHGSKDSYTTNNQSSTIHVIENKIKLPKIGFVKFIKHRELETGSTIKSCTVSKSKTGKYYISILVEFSKEIKKVIPKSILGLDMSMQSLFVDSQNNKANYSRFFRKSEKKLAKEQRILSKCKLGSNNRNKQRLKVSRVHEKIANQRLDFLHKLSRNLVNNYDVIVVEDIDLQNMSQCLNFGKSVSDNGFGMLRTFLNYKLEEAGKYFLKVGKWFPSSKTCSCCGFINKELTLKVRTWTCGNCNVKHDRDYNAAINIRNEGIKLLQETVGTTGLACDILTHVRVIEQEATTSQGGW
jgi:putative transposase